MNDKGLVLTHANSYYDENHTKDRFIEALRGFNGITYSVQEDGIPSYGEEEGLFNYLLDEEEDGKLKDKDADGLVGRHEKIFLGGGFARGCLRNTYDSLKKAVSKNVWEVEVKVVPEITYDRCFNFSNLRDEFGFNEIFTLDEVKDWDPDNLPEDISIYFENGDIESIL